MNAISDPARTPARHASHVPTVTLAHGGGGKAMKDLIDDVFVARVRQSACWRRWTTRRASVSPALAARGDRLAFTTDSFVVDPLFFPGGDIGKLAVCGTVNDLAVGGAVPLYLSCAAIVEEGCPSSCCAASRARWRRRRARPACASSPATPRSCERGACDKLFLTTTGHRRDPRAASNSARIWRGLATWCS